MSSTASNAYPVKLNSRVTAFGARRSLLHKVHDQLPSWSLYHLHPVGLGVVRLPPRLGGALVGAHFEESWAGVNKVVRCRDNIRYNM